MKNLPLIYKLLKKHTLFIVFFFVWGGLLCKHVHSHEHRYSPSEGCPSYTQDQSLLLGKAYFKGLPYDLGYTLAAIVVQESFVSDYVIRVNPVGSNESYGITHIELETAMYFEGVDNTWEGRAIIAYRLMVDDDYALDLAINKLERHSHKPYIDMVSSYNGRGAAAEIYANNILSLVRTIKKCYKYEGGF